MYWRSYNIWLVAIGLCSTAAATELSAPTNGICVGIDAYHHYQASLRGVTNQIIQWNDILLFGVFCQTGEVELACPEDLAYLAKIQMTSTDGQKVPLTLLGRGYGAKFDKLQSSEETRCTPLLAVPYAESQGQVPFPLSSYRSGASHNLAAGDLFEMKQPGVYTLDIQVQMFQVIKSTNSWTRKLIRFPPVAVKVEKPPPAPTTLRPGK